MNTGRIYRPKRVVILGLEYSIMYCVKPSDVDVAGRTTLWGQIDYWSRTIRIYDNGKRSDEDIWHSIIHEVLHGIGNALNIKWLAKKADEEAIDMLALGLMDTFFRNGWIAKARQ